MRKLTLAAALLAGSAITTPAFADGHQRIVEEPLELTIQMNHARYPICLLYTSPSPRDA